MLANYVSAKERRREDVDGSSKRRQNARGEKGWRWNVTGPLRCTFHFDNDCC